MISESRRTELLQMFAEGRHERLSLLCSQLLADDPSVGFLWNLLGAIEAKAGRHDQAISHYKTALKAEPGYLQPANNLAQSYIAIGQPQPALACLDDALASNPDLEDVLHTRGSIHLQQGERGLARRDLERCIELSDGHAKAWNTLGVLELSAANFWPAIDCFNAAVSRRPDMIEGWQNLAKALRRVGRVAEATTAYSKVLERDPNGGDALLGLALIEIEHGKTVAAREKLVRCIDLRFSVGQALMLLAEIDRSTVDDEIHQKIKTSQLQDVDMSQSDAMYLEYALGNINDRSGQFDQAFAHFERANELQRSARGDKPYDDGGSAAYLKSAEFPPRVTIAANGKSVSATPVFIVGMPRSGTTLIEQVVSNHSLVSGLGETDWLEAAIRKSGAGTQEGIGFDFEWIALEYHENIQKSYAPGMVFTDKMPLNFQWIGHIIHAFPDAKIIHVLRNPQAVCFSIFRQLFRGMGFSNTQQDIAVFYKGYLQLMSHWETQFPNRIHHLDYETFVEAPGACARRMFEYLGLAWEDGVLDVEKNPRMVSTASMFQARRAIYSGSSHHWEHYSEYLTDDILELTKFTPDSR